MSRVSLLLPAVVIATLALAAAAGGAPAKVKLKGEVGPGFTISLKDASGKAVKTLKAGAYVIEVSDKASIHNFRLSGPGVNKEITGVGFTGTKTVLVTLKPGAYRFQCDPHSSSINGSFKVV